VQGLLRADAVDQLVPVPCAGAEREGGDAEQQEVQTKVAAANQRDSGGQTHTQPSTKRSKACGDRRPPLQKFHAKRQAAALPAAAGQTTARQNGHSSALAATLTALPYLVQWIGLIVLFSKMSRKLSNTETEPKF
jgi:hypothetical protein